jgi:hypothetical protein
MNNGIALALALVCLMLLIVAVKWTLSQLNFLLALIAGLRQDSDNQWKAIHRLELSRCPITGAIHLMNPNPMDAKDAKTDSPPQGS